MTMGGNLSHVKVSLFWLVSLVVALKDLLINIPCSSVSTIETMVGLIWPPLLTLQFHGPN